LKLHDVKLHEAGVHLSGVSQILYVGKQAHAQHGHSLLLRFHSSSWFCAAEPESNVEVLMVKDMPEQVIALVSGLLFTAQLIQDLHYQITFLSSLTQMIRNQMLKLNSRVLRPYPPHQALDLVKVLATGGPAA
jgi:hypothetical protein